MNNYISRSAIVHTKEIGENVTIHEFAVIRSKVKIGNNVIIHPHVVIEDGVSIGNNVEIFPGAYIGKTPKGAGVLSRPPRYIPKVVIEDNCSIGVHATVYYDVIINNKTLIGDGASIREQVKIGESCVIGRYVTINYNTTIGDNVKIMDHTWLAGNIVIENNVFISGCVGTANDNQIGKEGYQESNVIGPYIKEGASIGLGALLLPATEIGREAVVGAGSVVTKNVPEKAVVMGIPAKVIRVNR